MTNRQKIEQLHYAISRCKKCLLYKTSTYAVPGEGNVDAYIMFIGEAPGRLEDETGRPFVGRAGQLLTRLIESIGLTREEVFITSVIKHRPPNNRNPEKSELHACKEWIDRQLAIIKPRLVIPLGRFGMEYFLPGMTISQAHGKFFQQEFWQVFPVYHPAYGLRGTKALKALEEDFRKLKKIL